jgi:tetratricopeptide (TPR) repeat protein
MMPRSSEELAAAGAELRRFGEAIEAHQQATAIYRETGDRHGEGMALNNLGLALREQGRLIKAGKAFTPCAGVAERVRRVDGTCLSETLYCQRTTPAP